MRALLFAGSVLMSLPAFACVNGMNEEDTRKSEADKLLAQAATKLDDRDYTAGLKSATAALEHRQASPATKRLARRLVGKARLKLGHFSEAAAAFRTCLEEAPSPNDPLLTARLAEAEVGMGKNAEGRARLESLNDSDLLPDADARVALARARFATGDTPGAYTALKAALDQEPDHAGALALKKHLDSTTAGKKSGAPRS